MIKVITVLLGTEQATTLLAKQLAAMLTAPLVVYLAGDLGSGKTTFVRAVLRALGVQGTVKSPTFSLLEYYQIADLIIYHFDLYRLSTPEELEFIGIRDYSDQTSVCFIEWPERGQDFIPDADLSFYFSFDGKQRQVKINCLTEKGQKCFAEF